MSWLILGHLNIYVTFPRQVRGSWLRIGKLAQQIDTINVIVVDLKEILLFKVMTGYVKEYAFKSDISKLFPTKYALGICKCFELVWNYFLWYTAVGLFVVDHLIYSPTSIKYP